VACAAPSAYPVANLQKTSSLLKGLKEVLLDLYVTFWRESSSSCGI